jgi:hypothetical protein
MGFLSTVKGLLLVFGNQVGFVRLRTLFFSHLDPKPRLRSLVSDEVRGTRPPMGSSPFPIYETPLGSGWRGQLGEGLLLDQVYISGGDFAAGVYVVTEVVLRDWLKGLRLA